jgi:hypothetical protein
MSASGARPRRAPRATTPSRRRGGDRTTCCRGRVDGQARWAQQRGALTLATCERGQRRGRWPAARPLQSAIVAQQINALEAARGRRRRRTPSEAARANYGDARRRSGAADGAAGDGVPGRTVQQVSTRARACAGAARLPLPPPLAAAAAAHRLVPAPQDGRLLLRQVYGPAVQRRRAERGREQLHRPVFAEVLAGAERAGRRRRRK